MKRTTTLILAFLLIAVGFANAQQIVTSSPSPLQEGSADVVITYHADLGNQGLMGINENEPVYAHAGVITNLSNGKWDYAPAWLTNTDKYRLTYAGPNTWQLNIGDIRTYFGITNPDEHVLKLAFVFRNANGSREGKTASGGDIFLDVYEDGFQLELTSDAPAMLTSETSTVTFTVGTTQLANIGLYLNDTASEPIASADNATQLVKVYDFAPGSYQVIAVATAGGETLTKSLNIVYPGNSKPQDYPGGVPKMGATVEANGDVTFCLAAPGKHDVMLMPSWCSYEARAENVMNYTDVNGIRYFWTTVSGLDMDTEYPYYYLVDGVTSVGDPYARLILDPYNDKNLSDGTFPGLIPYPSQYVKQNVMLAVFKGNRDEYPWRVDNFKGVDQDDLIIYEMLIRDFTGTEGQAKGNGTLKLAMDKLDYLQTLGVNAIELMPIQDFNGNNSWGYNTNFYFAPDKAYGSPDDYRAFIDECHSRGIAVILDVVFNQSDGLHPWYVMYPSNNNPFYNQRAPHAYSVLNDWNQDNLLVQQQWTDMITYWMTAYRVDGFRFDLVKGLGDNESYGGNASEANTNKYNASRIERMKRLTEVMHAINPNSYSINENLAGAQEENAMAANGQLNWANINNAACQFAMGWSSDSNCNRFYAPKDSRTWGSTVSYAESHDEQRVAYKQDMWGATGVKGDLGNSMRRCGSVAAQMLLSPGAHMIWQFGELGNNTNTKNSNGGNNTDPKRVLWSYYDNPDRRGLYDNYCQLIGIRAANPDMFDENAGFSMACNTSDWNNGRYIYITTPAKELLCMINPTLNAGTFTFKGLRSANNDDYRVVSSSYDVAYTFDAATGQITLAPGSYVVVANTAVASIDAVASDTVTAKAYGADGEIVIIGDYMSAQVYSITGAPMPSFKVAPGVYIVVIDGTPTKVLVH